MNNIADQIEDLSEDGEFPDSCITQSLLSDSMTVDAAMQQFLSLFMGLGLAIGYGIFSPILLFISEKVLEKMGNYALLHNLISIPIVAT